MTWLNCFGRTAARAAAPRTKEALSLKLFCNVSRPASMARTTVDWKEGRRGERDGGGDYRLGSHISGAPSLCFGSKVKERSDLIKTRTPFSLNPI